MLRCWVLLVMVAVVVEGQHGCEEQRTCDGCIQTPDCMWCSKPKDVFNHCQHHSLDLASFCNPADLENPFNWFLIMEDVPLTGITTITREDGPETIHFSPQRTKLKLRKGVPQNISIKYLVTDAAVDLYFLMDLSYSMKDDLENLARMSSILSDLLGNLTSNYRIGFGSFVDKVLMPFTDTSPARLREPCPGCAPPFSYRNNLPLTNDSSLFTERVKTAHISGNTDAPEGGLDALMQAIVCEEQVGWRQQAKKIILFSTDAKFHCAGDGRLAGIIVPNDENCHLNDANEYTAYDKYDYPSIGQINKVAYERDINIIFAVINNFDIYKQLSSLVRTSTVGSLDSGSTNMIELIKEQYQKIPFVVRLSDNSSSEVRVEYRSRCMGDGPLMTTNRCSGLRRGDTIDFILQVTANECPSDGKTMYLGVKALDDSFVLEINFECSCGCKSMNVSKAEECYGHGMLVCGLCECDPDYRGENCQCFGSSGQTVEQDVAMCTASGEDNVCSGLGYCSCGTCLCRDPDVFGTYCNCNRRKCMSGREDICSGHGTCQCNTCQCDAGYMGTLCECPDSSFCIAPGSTEECSGHGQCVCGRCQCLQAQGEVYTGEYCQDCPTCPAGKCHEFRDCVLCQNFNLGPLIHDNLCQTCTITSSITDSLQDQVRAGDNTCDLMDEEGCYFFFIYRYNSHLAPSGTPPYQVYVQRQRLCPPPVQG